MASDSSFSEYDGLFDSTDDDQMITDPDGLFETSTETSVNSSQDVESITSQRELIEIHPNEGLDNTLVYPYPNMDSHPFPFVTIAWINRCVRQSIDVVYMWDPKVSDAESLTVCGFDDWRTNRDEQNQQNETLGNCPFCWDEGILGLTCDFCPQHDYVRYDKGIWLTKFKLYKYVRQENNKYYKCKRVSAPAKEPNIRRDRVPFLVFRDTYMKCKIYGRAMQYKAISNLLPFNYTATKWLFSTWNVYKNDDAFVREVRWDDDEIEYYYRINWMLGNLHKEGPFQLHEYPLNQRIRMKKRMSRITSARNHNVPYDSDMDTVDTAMATAYHRSMGNETSSNENDQSDDNDGFENYYDE